MRLLLVSSRPDMALWSGESSVKRRALDYGEIAEVHVITYAREARPEPMRIGKRVTVHVAHAMRKGHRVRDALALLAQFGPCDRIISLDMEAAGVARRIAQKSGVPFSVYVDEDVYGASAMGSGVRRMLYRMRLRGLFSRAACVYAASERVYRGIAAQGCVLPTRLFLLPLRAGEKGEGQALVLDDPKRVTILAITHEYGANDIVSFMRACAHVVKKYPHTRIVLVGGAGEEPRVQALIARHNLYRNVVFQRRDADYRELYREAHLCVYIAKQDGYAEELLFAASMQCPIITTDVGIVGDVLTKDHAFVCDPGDEICMRKSIVIAMENKHMCAHLAREAQKAVRRAMPAKKSEYMEELKRSLMCS